jgi:hypothetical protein
MSEYNRIIDGKILKKRKRNLTTPRKTSTAAIFPPPIPQALHGSEVRPLA